MFFDQLEYLLWIPTPTKLIHNNLQAGFIVLLFNEFRSTIITGVGYFLLTLFVQAWTLAYRFRGQVYFYWPDGLYIFFVLHKFSEYLEMSLSKRTPIPVRKINCWKMGISTTFQNHRLVIICNVFHFMRPIAAIFVAVPAIKEISQ